MSEIVGGYLMRSSLSRIESLTCKQKYVLTVKDPKDIKRLKIHVGASQKVNEEKEFVVSFESHVNYVTSVDKK